MRLHLRTAVFGLALAAAACSQPPPPPPAEPPPPEKPKEEPKPKGPTEAEILKERLAKLTTQLRKGDTDAKLKAMNDLRAIGPKARPAAPDLFGYLLDEEVALGRAAVEALEKVWPDVGQPALALQVRGSRKDVLDAFRKLGELESDAQPAVPVIVAIVQREHDLARAYAPPPPPAKNAPRPKTNSALESAHASVEVVVGGLTALKKIAPDDPALIALLVKLAKPLPNQVARTSGKEGVTDRIAFRALEMMPAVATTFPKQAGPLVTALIEALDDPLVRMRALVSLKEIGPGAKAATTKLKNLKFDPIKSVSDAAIAALAEIEPG